MDIAFPSPEIVETTVSPKFVTYGFFNRFEKINYSLLQIFCPIFYYSNGLAIEGGLCDPSMGIMTRFGFCNICRNGFSRCPGHFGLIKTIIPLVNPFCENIFLSIRKIKCDYCNFFKPTFAEKKIFQKKIGLKKKKKNFKRNKNMRKNLSTTNNKCPTYFPSPKTILVEKFVQKTFDSQKESFNEFSIFNSKLHNKEKNLRKNIWIKKFFEDNSKIETCENCGKKKTKEPQIYRDSNVQTNFWDIFYNSLKMPFLKLVTDSNKSVLLNNPYSCYFPPRKFCLDMLQFFQLTEEVSKICKNEGKICKYIWSHNYRSSNDHLSKINSHFFFDSILVLPTRFRPIFWSGSQSSRKASSSSSLNFIYSNIIKLNHQILIILKENIDRKNLTYIHSLAFSLQSSFLKLVTNNKSSNSKEKDSISGVKQHIEKKEGLFRMHIMGKRVINTSRSIIVPDPFLNGNEIGFPNIFSSILKTCKILNHSSGELRKRISRKMNGKFPNKSQPVFQTCSGGNIKLVSSFSPLKVLYNIKTVLDNHQSLQNQRGNFYGLNLFFDNVSDFDLAIVNRQPSLHRLSMMTHRVKIYPGLKCIRLNYLNCSSYNADFDGDEMNIHIPSGLIPMAEGKFLSMSENHVRSSTNGEPIRGLIQDHIIGLVKLSGKNCFLAYSIFVHLSNYFSIPKKKEKYHSTCIPAIVKPFSLWTGKQLISSIIERYFPEFNFESRTKIPSQTIGEDETRVIFRRGNFLKGILDGSQAGKSKYGLFNALVDIYGSDKIAVLSDSLAKILTIFLRTHGHTSNIPDFMPIKKMEKLKMVCKILVKRASYIYIRKFISAIGISFNFNKFYEPFYKRISLVIALLTLEKRKFDSNSNLVKGFYSGISNKILDKFILGGLKKTLGSNNFLKMCLSGAKGSILNIFQICLYIGQTELDKGYASRSPVGKSLPCFKPYDIGSLSIGFINDRFLTGLKQSAFYFHSMAGREGVLDTSVKTSQSGYIQRSLVKHTETIKMEYDFTQRQRNNVIIQMVLTLNGFQSINIDMSHLNSFRTQNSKVFSLFSTEIENIKNSPNGSELIAGFFEDRSLLSVPLNDYVNYLRRSFFNRKTIKNSYLNKINKRGFFFNQNLENSSHIPEIWFGQQPEPGDPVGIVISQSIGEPCTQMTLNTFHNAGKLTNNTNLGIPRLKELLLSTNKLPRSCSISIDVSHNFSNIMKSLKKLSRNQKNNSIFNSIKYTFIKFPKTLAVQLIFKVKNNKLFNNNIEKYMELFIKNLRLFFDNHFKLLECQLKNPKKRNQTFNNNSTKKLSLKSNLQNQISISGKKSHIAQLLFNSQAFGITKNFKLKSEIFEFINKISMTSFESVLDLTKADFNLFWDSEKKKIHVTEKGYNSLLSNICNTNYRKSFSNDILSVYTKFGIEAVRSSLIFELKSVFDFHAITIKQDNIELVADYLTNNGKIKAFNRGNMVGDTSFQSISYEMATTFLSNFAIQNDSDPLETVSSNLVFAKICKIGTGSFELFYRI